MGVRHRRVVRRSRMRIRRRRVLGGSRVDVARGRDGGLVRRRRRRIVCGRRACEHPEGEYDKEQDELAHRWNLPQFKQ
jgi:hypothetical protein